ncbi:hypothetical protein ALC56_07144, partial [Trachymyrmex septentrionalis]
KKPNIIGSTSFVFVIQLNLYTFLNGAPRKIIDNRINVVSMSTVTINKKNFKVITKFIKKKWPKGAQRAYMLFFDQIK